MTEERRFALEDAEALLPELRERLPRLRDARRRLIAASERVSEEVARDGGGVAGTDVLLAERDLRAELEWLAGHGVLLRDAEEGLVDFPSERDGQPMYLCWRLDEAGIGWWHDLTSGFVGRRPL